MRGLGIMLLGVALLGCPGEGDKKKSDDKAESGEDQKKKKKDGKKADDGEKKKKKKKKDAEAPAAAKGGAETPEKAFEMMKKATADNDYKTLFTLLTKEPQDKMLTGMLLGAAITLAPMGTKPNPEKQKELEAIMKKHGLEDTKYDAKGGGPDALMAEMAKKLAPVKDRPQLFEDLMKFLEKNSLKENRVELLSMEDLKIDGDKATAKINTKDDKGKTGKDDVELKKVDGRWYFHVLDWK